MDIELREYQNKQLDFLNSKVASRGQVFMNNIALCSPTGSGKSYVMLEFIKRYFEDHQGMKVIISTGFNNLVKQFYEDAKKFNIPCIMLAGKGKCACTEKLRKKGTEGKYNIYNAFDAKPSERCSRNKCHDCKLSKSNECLYNAILNEIKQNQNLLIVTNHSTILARKDFFEEYTNGGFIDECQTFADFYEAHLRVEVTFLQLKALYTYMGKDFGLKTNPFTKIFKQACLNGTLSKNTIEKVLDLPTMQKNWKKQTKKIKDCYPIMANDMYEYIDTEPQMNNYIYPQIVDGRHVGLLVDNFFDSVDIDLNFCITSATVDSYTKTIFGGIMDDDLYNETGYKTIDYSKSKLYLYNGFTDNNIKHFLAQNKGKEHGLLLSTRLDLVDKLDSKIGDYEIIKKVDDFVKGKKQILAGSKSLFQGIDIPDVDFVMLNKIPFSRYDEGYKKKMRFFETRGRNAFTFYTKPYTENQLIQSMGRLWRSPGDYGNIALFDSTACLKHIGILKNALACREGIKCIEYKNGKLSEWRL